MSDIDSKGSGLSSPTSLAAKRLGNRVPGPRPPSPAGSSVTGQSTRSRRSVSRISSAEDAEVFERMSVSTGVVLKKTQDNDLPTSPLDSLIQGAESTLRSFSPNTSVAEPSVSSAGFSFDDFSSVGAVPRKDLDLKHNDNSFQVIASLLVDLVDKRKGGALQWNDRVVIERLLPSPYSFVEAVRFRLERTPREATTPLHHMTFRCQELGLDGETTEENPILAALEMLPPDDSTGIVSSNVPDTDSTIAAETAASRSFVSCSASNATETAASRSVLSSSASNAAETAASRSVLSSSASNAPETAASRSVLSPAVAAETAAETAASRSVLSPAVAAETAAVQAVAAARQVTQKASTVASSHASVGLSVIDPVSSVYKSFSQGHEDTSQSVSVMASLASASQVSKPLGSRRELSVDEQSQLEEKKKEVEASVAESLGEFNPRDTDTIARKQLLAELREAKKLMNESSTPETRKFWQDHVSDLETRLRALQGETMCSPREISPVTVQPASPASASETSRKNDNPLLSQFQSRKEDIVRRPLNASHSYESGAGGDPRLLPSHSQQSSPDYGAPMVDVVSPADLPGGYRFEAEIEGQRFLATVPAGGVQQGETFTCYMRELDSVAIDIPVGYWKDEPTNIFKYGCCHPVLWTSILCPLLTLSQIQHRVDLDFLGRPKTTKTGVPSRTMLLSVIAFWLFINAGLFLGYNMKWSQGFELTNADWAAFALINGAYVAFNIFVTQSTRSSLREKFLIREQRFYDLEDLYSATCFMPCTVAQMSRHTANFDDYEAVCCSQSGLPDGIRVNQQPPVKDSGYVV